MHESRRVFLLSLGALAACGGGSSSAPAPDPSPPVQPTAERLVRIASGWRAPLWGYAKAGKLWKSEDGGSTWSSVPGPTFDKLVGVFTTGVDTLWVTALEGTTPVLWRGTTAGTGWAKRTLPAATPASFDVSSDDGNNLKVSWGVSSSGMSSFYFSYQSTDGGLTWSATDYVFNEIVSTGTRWRFAKVMRGTNFGYRTYGQVQQSRDTGLTWQTRLPLADSRAGSVMLTSDPAVMVVVSYDHHDSMGSPEAPVDWRIHLTRDGGSTWAEWDAPAAVQAFTAIGGATAQGLLVASRLEDTRRLRSKDFGRTWQDWTLPTEVAGLSIAVLELGTLWASNGFATFISLDQGDTWTAVTQLPGTSPAFRTLRQTGATKLLAELSDGGGVSISQDSGKTWQEVMVR